MVISNCISTMFLSQNKSITYAIREHSLAVLNIACKNCSDSLLFVSADKARVFSYTRVSKNRYIRRTRIQHNNDIFGKSDLCCFKLTITEMHKYALVGLAADRMLYI